MKTVSVAREVRAKVRVLVASPIPYAVFATRPLVSLAHRAVPELNAWLAGALSTVAAYLKQPGACITTYLR